MKIDCFIISPISHIPKKGKEKNWGLREGRGGEEGRAGARDFLGSLFSKEILVGV